MNELEINGYVGWWVLVYSFIALFPFCGALLTPVISAKEITIIITTDISFFILKASHSIIYLIRPQEWGPRGLITPEESLNKTKVPNI